MASRTTEILRRIRGQQVQLRTPADTRRIARTQSVEALADLVFEALSSYVDDPLASAASPAGSLQHIIAVTLKELLPANELLRGLVGTYADTVRHERMRAAGGRSFVLYRGFLAGCAQLPLREAIGRLVAARLVGVGLKDPPDSAELVPYRRLHGWVDRVVCRDTEEAGSDEIYLATFGMVYTAKSTLFTQSNVSKVTEDVDPGETVGLAAGDRLILDQKLQEPVVPGRVPPVCAVLCVTLFEQESGDQERIQAGMSAMADATKLLAAAAAGSGYVSVAVIVAALIYDLIVALDGDDELGSIIYKLDDWLTTDCIEYRLPATIRGSNNANEYRYDVVTCISTEHILGPRPTLKIEGASSVVSRSEVTTQSFRLVADTVLGNIRWQVRPSSADDAALHITTREDGYQASITFEGWGGYEILVSATNLADNTPLTGRKTFNVLKPARPWSEP